jgi:hypothetical protein
MEVLLSNQPDIERLARAESLAEARAQAAIFGFTALWEVRRESIDT